MRVQGLGPIGSRVWLFRTAKLGGAQPSSLQKGLGFRVWGLRSSLNYGPGLGASTIRGRSIGGILKGTVLRGLTTWEWFWGFWVWISLSSISEASHKASFKDPHTRYPKVP